MMLEELTEAVRLINNGEPFSSVVGFDLPEGGSMDMADIKYDPEQERLYAERERRKQLR
jgi:hypothetical protein